VVNNRLLFLSPTALRQPRCANRVAPTALQL
jgi:hypothetical protein